MTAALDSKEARHLAIVAHHDDDLLFMHADLREVIDTGGRVRVVYLTASDADEGPPYANDREIGVQSAYWSAVDVEGFRAVSDAFAAEALGDASPPPGSTSRSRYADRMRSYIEASGIWTELEADARNPKRRVLGLDGADRITLQFLRVRSSITYAASAMTGRTWLYNIERGQGDDGQPGRALPIADVDGENTYTRSQLVDMLGLIILSYQPTVIHIQSPEAPVPEVWRWPFPYPTDHADHIATARLAREAAAGADYLGRVVQHVCYPSSGLPPNVSDADAAAAKALFLAYARFDYHYGSDVTMSDSAWSDLPESAWVRRRYYS